MAGPGSVHDAIEEADRHEARGGGHSLLLDGVQRRCQRFLKLLLVELYEHQGGPPSIGQCLAEGPKDRQRGDADKACQQDRAPRHGSAGQRNPIRLANCAPRPFSGSAGSIAIVALSAAAMQGVFSVERVAAPVAPPATAEPLAARARLSCIVV